MELTMRQGIKLPVIGFGTYLIPEEEAHAAVTEALRIGYRHVDTAEFYQNENGVGHGIRDSIKELGLSREDVFVTTKLWPGAATRNQPAKTHATTIASLNTSLEKLQLDYVDLYLIHAPLSKQHRLEQWQALVELQQSGKTRTIGVSNYSEAHIEEIRDAGLPLPIANQIELHPWSQKPDLVAYLKKNDIAIIAYSSLVPLSTWRIAPGHGSGKTDEMRREGQQADAPFKLLAQKYGVTEAQILLRWAVQLGYAVLPKSTVAERIRQNFDLLSFAIDEADMAAIAEMDRGNPLAWGQFDPVTMS